MRVSQTLLQTKRLDVQDFLAAIGELICVGGNERISVKEARQLRFFLDQSEGNFAVLLRFSCGERAHAAAFRSKTLYIDSSHIDLVFKRGRFR